MATATRPRKTTGGRPADGANFDSKRERKRIRKSLIRAALANWVAAKRSAHAERAEFYRNLRRMKERRIQVAKAMRILAIEVTALQQQLRRVEDRNPTVPLKLLDEALDLGRAARASVEAAAAEWELFAKQKIYFTEVMA